MHQFNFEQYLQANLYSDRFTVLAFENFGKFNAQVLISAIHSLINDSTLDIVKKDSIKK